MQEPQANQGSGVGGSSAKGMSMLLSHRSHQTIESLGKLAVISSDLLKWSVPIIASHPVNGNAFAK